MAKKITALFIRDDSVNALVVDGPRVEKWASAPLEAGLVTQGLIADEEKVALAIRDLFKQNGLRGGKVVTGIAGAGSLYRIITLPEMPDALLGEAVRREARRVLPISLDEVNLSYQAVPAAVKGERKLFLATYPKNTTEAMIRTVRRAGLDPYLMDLAPLALARVPDEARSIVVSVRANQADIIVVEDRLPQLIRVLSLPSEASSLAEKLSGVAEELTRTVIFYNSSHGEKPLNQSVPLFVCGELADDPATWPQLAGRLNFNVALLPTPLEHAEDFPANEFMVNMGLALKEFAAERAGANFSIVNLNILPEVYHPKRIPLSYVLVPVMAVIGIAVVAYMASFVVRGRADTARLRDELAKSEPPIAQQTTRVAELKAEVTRVTPLTAPVEAQIAQVNATTAVHRSTMAGLQSNRTRVDGDLKNRAVGVLPTNKSNLSITSVGHDGASITITGDAAREDYIFQYSRKIRETGIGVLVSNIQATESGYTFSLVVK
jgi:type IV pilus assembly protein PilM